MKKKSSALLYVGIPFVVGISLIVVFVISCILESPTNRGTIYVILLDISMIGSILVPIPGSIFSVLGIKKAVKVRKDGESNIGFPILIGIVNIVVSFLMVILWLYVIFIGGAGV